MDVLNDDDRPATRGELRKGFEFLFGEITKDRKESERRDNELNQKMERLTRIAVESSEAAKTFSEKILTWKEMLQDHEARLGSLEAKS